MFRIKHKLLITTLLSALFLLPALAVVPRTVFADHGTCSDDPRAGATQISNCISSKRNSYNVACYETHAGNNDAIADCVRQVDAHFEDTSGSPPPLPTSITRTSGSLGSGANVTDTADCKVDPNTEDLNSNNCRIVYWINLAINVLSVMVGIVVTIMIIVGGIQYTAAREDPNAVAKAKKQIFNAVFALVLYGLMFALLQYLIPGGLL